MLVLKSKSQNSRELVSALVKVFQGPALDMEANGNRVSLL